MLSRRNENAAERMFENSKIQTLSEEQHEALSELCRMRHEIHSNQESLYISEASEQSLFSELYQILNEINKLFKNKLILPNPEDFPSDDDKYNDIIENTEEAEEENLAEFYKMMNKLNSDIEKYLKNIDKEHKTNYCPTGATRIF